jgi:lipoprotein-releasing system permease protein
VIGSAPFVRKEAMLTHRGMVNGALIQGVLPGLEPQVSVITEKIIIGALQSLEPGTFNVILGRELAHSLGARLGDKVTVVAPQPSVTVAGIMPRLKRFTVSGIFEIGMHEYDSALALAHMDDAARVFRLGAEVSGIRLKLDDVYAAPAIARDIVRELERQGYPGSLAVIDWTQYHVNFFKALQTEKTVMFVILALIVAVAAFNIVSTLVMVVTDKQTDVAVLRTLGMHPAGVMGIFVVQGTVIGLVGTLLGVAAGVWLALNVETIVPAIEEFFRVKFLPADVYYISELPSDLNWRDVVNISAMSFVLCLVATLYPAWQASQTRPAEALRYE